jgi:HSP20 family protein
MFDTFFTRFPEIERSFALMDELRRRMDDGPQAGVALDRSFPRGLLVERPTEFALEVELPGVAEADLKLSVHEDVLTLAGTRAARAPEGHTTHLAERGSFRFSRSWSLPTRVDVDKTTARLEHGVLMVTLPKHADAQPRQITVTTR